MTLRFNGVRVTSEVGNGPYGVRYVAYPLSDIAGSFDGPGLRGDVLSAGGDFFLLDANEHVGRVNARKLLKTDDGALIYDHVRGVLDVKAINKTAEELAVAKLDKV